jgi:hypothetical protein
MVYAAATHTLKILPESRASSHIAVIGWSHATPAFPGMYLKKRAVGITLVVF